jgi:hypothetical protein
VILAVACAIAGCGGGTSHTATTSTQARTTPKPRRTYPPPKYFPSAHHAHRPRGYIYNDEVGENVLIAPYDRIIQVFGPPAIRHGNCIEYKIVQRPSDHWKFCFRGQKMISAAG